MSRAPQIEVPLADQDLLYADYAACGSMQAVANKHGYSVEVVSRLATQRKWKETLAATIDEFKLAASTKAAKAAVKFIEEQIDDVAELRRRGKDLFDASAGCTELDVRAKAEATANGHYMSGDKIRNSVLDRIMPTSDGKPGVAVQVNVDNREQIVNLMAIPQEDLDAMTPEQLQAYADLVERLKTRTA